jgi:trimethylamine corrinoid protein
LSREEVFAKLRRGILEYDAEMTERAANDVIDKGFSVAEAVAVLSEAIRQVGEKYARVEIFLADLMLAADAMQAGSRPLLSRMLESERPRLGTFVIGTVQGDIHDIGKNIVIAMLTSAGFDVHDLGKDCPAPRFAEQAEAVRADIVGASSLMTTTQPVLRDIFSYFKETGIRSKYKIMVGGAAVTKEYAEQIGADGYSPNAVEAVDDAKSLLAGRKQ